MDASNYNIIHGFDPGGITGYVRYNRSSCKIENFEGIKGYYEISKILNFINKESELVVMESPVGKITTSDQLEMCKYCGFIEGYCESNDIICIPQAPMVRAGFRRPASKYFKKYHSGYVVHNIDAFAHVLKFISKREGIDWIERL